MQSAGAKMLYHKRYTKYDILLKSLSTFSQDIYEYIVAYWRHM